MLHYATGMQSARFRLKETEVKKRYFFNKKLQRVKKKQKWRRSLLIFFLKAIALCESDLGPDSNNLLRESMTFMKPLVI